MISFLSSAKPFFGRNRDNQLKALRSWLAVSAEAEAILYGYSQGAHEVCHELGIRYVPDIKSSPTGVPYFSAIVDHARQHARHDTQIYLNCDILMTDSLLKAINKVTLKKYLVIGQRIDLDEDVNFEIDRSDWMEQLLRLKERAGISLHPPTGKDYFVFPRGLWDEIPPLIIGRIGYDDALLAFCLERGIPIIDATHDIVAIHQFHDYKHLPAKQAGLVRGSDDEHNVAAIGARHSLPEVSDANWILRFGTLKKAYARGDYLRYAELFFRFKMGWVAVSYALRALWRVLSALRVYHDNSFTLEDVLKGYAKTVTTATSSGSRDQRHSAGTTPDNATRSRLGSLPTQTG